MCSYLEGHVRGLSDFKMLDRGDSEEDGEMEGGGEGQVALESKPCSTARKAHSGGRFAAPLGSSCVSTAQNTIS